MRRCYMTSEKKLAMTNRVYMDNCCYNRPFDEPLTPDVRLEKEAKIYIQQQIRSGKIELAWSFILDHESRANPHEDRKRAIIPWKYRATVDIDPCEEVYRLGLIIKECGVKVMDAQHIACAIAAKCHYFLTTDKGILKKKVEGIILMNPVDYVHMVERGR